MSKLRSTVAVRDHVQVATYLHEPEAIELYAIAASYDKSVSRFVREVLLERMQKEARQKAG